LACWLRLWAPPQTPVLKEGKPEKAVSRGRKSFFGSALFSFVQKKPPFIYLLVNSNSLWLPKKKDGVSPKSVLLRLTG
jgi:hypothetical protein